jgi:t-SNARE complex subunit (syntaxin)
VYAAQVNSKWQAGDLEGAAKSSKNAKLWAWLSAGIGIALAIIYIVVVVVLGVGSAIFSGVFGS